MTARLRQCLLCGIRTRYLNAGYCVNCRLNSRNDRAAITAAAETEATRRAAWVRRRIQEAGNWRDLPLEDSSISFPLEDPSISSRSRKTKSITISGTATFVKHLSGWRGKQTSLYKLSLPLQDYDYVAVNCALNYRGEPEGLIFGASSEGEVAEMVSLTREIKSSSHTDILLNAGYRIVLEGSEKEEMAIWIDKWTVTGTSVDKETGKPKEYVVSRSASDEWGCSCPAWKFRVGKKVDCQHISAKKLKLLQAGIATTQQFTSDINASTAKRKISLDD
jgi:hypothetical protein